MVFNNPKFDLNEKPCELNENDQFHDTALRLECSGHGTISSEIARSNELVLGLGPTPSVCSNYEQDLVLRLSLSHYSDSSRSDSNPFSNRRSTSVEVSKGYVVDEGSSATSGGGYMPSLLLAPRTSFPLHKLKIPEPGSRVRHPAGGPRCVVLGDCVCHGCKTGGDTCKVHGSGKRRRDDKTAFYVPGPRIFHGPVSGLGSPDNRSLSGSSSVSSCISLLGNPAKRRQMIPPQVLVPLSMKSSSETNVNGERKSFKVGLKRAGSTAAVYCHR